MVTMTVYLVEEEVYAMDIGTTIFMPRGIFTEEEKAIAFAKDFTEKNVDWKNSYGCHISKWLADDTSWLDTRGKSVEYIQWEKEG